MEFYMQGPHETSGYYKTKKKVFTILGINQLEKRNNQSLPKETNQPVSITAVKSYTEKNGELHLKTDSNMDQIHTTSVTQSKTSQQTINNSEKLPLRKNIVSFYSSSQDNNENEESKTTIQRFSYVSSILRRRSSNNQTSDCRKNRVRFFSSPSLPELSGHFPLSKSQQEFHNSLLKNIQIHSCKKIRCLLRKRVYDLGSYSNTLMHDAAFKCCEKCLKSLIKNGCSISQKDDAGFIPLHAAVMGENMQTLTFLLEHTAHANETSNDGWTALHLAVILNNLKMVHSITMRGGNPYLISKLQSTPFKLCIEMKRTLILDYFIYLKQS